MDQKHKQIENLQRKIKELQEENENLKQHYETKLTKKNAELRTAQKLFVNCCQELENFIKERGKKIEENQKIIEEKQEIFNKKITKPNHFTKKSDEKILKFLDQFLE